MYMYMSHFWDYINYHAIVWASIIVLYMYMVAHLVNWGVVVHTNGMHTIIL